MPNRLPIPIRDALQVGSAITRIWREWLQRLVENVDSLETEDRPSPEVDVEGDASRVVTLSSPLDQQALDELERRLLLHQSDLDDELQSLRRQIATLSGSAPSGIEDVRRLLATLPIPEINEDWADEGTHANRPTAAARLDGFVYFETDRDSHFIAIGGTWYFVSGRMSGTISPDQKPGDLGSADENFRFWSTDFAREYRWTGAAWEDSPGAPERFMVAVFDSTPGTGWQLCDGSTVTRSNATGGTTGSYTVPDHSTAEYLKVGNSKSLNQSAGGTTASTTVNPDAHTTTAVMAGAGATVLDGPADHTLPGHTHGPGTLELDHSQYPAYVRL